MNDWPSRHRVDAARIAPHDGSWRRAAEAREASSVVDGGVTALRNFRAPGAYVLRVRGPMRDLAPFLLGQLVTAPNMATVTLCERPGCGHLIVKAAGAGRPRQFCSDSCWVE